MTDPTRGTAIRMLLELLQELTTTPPMLYVTWSDFPLWLAHFGAERFMCALRADGRVDLTVTGHFGQWGPVFATTAVDMVRDLELPPFVSGEYRTHVHLPAVELERCELFSKVVA